MTDAQIKVNSPETISCIMDKYGERIYNMALRMLSNAEDAEDVLQETLLKVLEKGDDFSGKSSVYTWIYKIAVNEALQKIRKRKFTGNVPDDLENLESADSLLHSPATQVPEEVILTDELQNELQAALERIPEMYRTVFVLRDLEEFSTQDTAEILNLSESNVKVRLRRARLMLRKNLCTYFERCDEVN